MDEDPTMEEVEALTRNVKKILEEKKDITTFLLEAVIDLESCIDSLLERYFIREPDKRIEFKKFLLEKEFFTFGNKINLLQKLAFEKINPDNFNPNTYKKLRRIQEMRNKIAHSPKSYDKDKSCWKVKNGEQDILFDKRFQEDIMKEYLEVLSTLVLYKIK